MWTGGYILNTGYQELPTALLHHEYYSLYSKVKDYNNLP